MSFERDTLSGAVVNLEREMGRAPCPRVFAPLAEAYRLQGRLDDALRVAQAGLLSYPDHIAIRLVLARALSDSGRNEEAAQAYREVALGDPGNMEARAFTGLPDQPAHVAVSNDEPLLTERVSLSDELAHLSELFSERPTEPTFVEQDLEGIATLTLAEIYARQGLPDRAVEVCERILARDPQDQEAARRLDEYRNDLASVR